MQPNPILESYFAKYAESHQNPVNKFIHWVCVPLIVFSLLGLVWAIPFPALPFLGRGQRYLNWATFLIVFAVIYYLRLSFRLAMAMVLLIIIFSTIIIYLERMERLNDWPLLWQICLGIFVISWFGQFIGHKIEGKKPSFLDDLKFLLIGPVWLLHFLFKQLGIEY